MNKEKVLESIEKLAHDIHHWNTEIIMARSKRDDNRVSYAHWAMESLLVAAYQEFLFLAGYVKEHIHDDEEIEAAFKHVDEVQYQNGYRLGKHEILTELDEMLRTTQFGDTEGDLLTWIEEKENEQR